MYPKEYLDFLVEFHAKRDYFECHEIGEEYWKEKVKKDEKNFWLGLIQMAVSFYHWRRKNQNGAVRMMKSAIKNLEKSKKTVATYGINDKKIINQLGEIIRGMEKEELYKSYSFPIEDKNLIKMCKNSCKEQNLTWNKKSDMTDEVLVHKHKLRDRTSVIEERAKRLMEKRKSNG